MVNSKANRRSLTLDNLRYLLVLPLVVLLFVQIEVMNISARSLTAYHLWIAFAANLMVCQWIIQRRFIVSQSTGFLLVFVATLLVPAMLVWPLKASNLLLVFAVMAFALGMQAGRLDERQRKKIYTIAAAIFILATITRNLVQIENLGIIYSRARNCPDCFLATGGRNIEGTMFAILAILYQGQFRRSFGLIMTVTVLLFQSRIGVIGATVFWFSEFVKYQITFRAIVVTMLAPIIVIVVVSMVPLDAIFGRFDLGKELALKSEGLGRLALWSATFELLPLHPFGIGPGNAVPVINSELNRGFWENNIHNVFLTWIVELGWLHGAVLVVFVFKVLANSRQTIEFYAVLYVVLCSMFEFTGYDAIYWFLLGIASCEMKKGLGQ